MNYHIPVEVDIAEIADNDLFRVSRKIYPSGLSSSLKLTGMLEIPWIIKNSPGYIALTCHNRIKILRESGIKSLKCHVLNDPDVHVFMNYVSLKAYRNELGPAGKLKFILLLTDTFKISDMAVSEYCKKNLKLPDDVINDRKFIERFFLFQDSLITYLDEKDISLRIIRDLINLPSNWLGIISNWTAHVQIRVNFFKMIIENISDIYRRGDHISVIESILYEDDKTLYDEVYRIRYPRYTKMKTESDFIIRNLTGPGLSIDFPEYFDRSFITIKLNIDKKSDCSGQLKKITAMNPARLNELISLL